MKSIEMEIASRRGLVYSFAVHKFPNIKRYDLEDIVQDTMLKAIANARKYDSHKLSLDAWLQVILRSVALDWLRTARRNEAQANDIDYSLDNPVVIVGVAQPFTAKDILPSPVNQYEVADSDMVCEQLIESIQSELGRDVARCVVAGMNWPEIGRRYKFSRTWAHRVMQKQVRPKVAARMKALGCTVPGLRAYTAPYAAWKAAQRAKADARR